MKKKMISLVMVLTLIMGFSVTAMAAPEASPANKDVDGQGYIANDTGSVVVLIDLTAPANFLWYADAGTFNGTNYDIKSGVYKIVNHSQNVNLQVEILDYTSTTVSSNPVVESDVTLNLTDDLAADGHGQDLFSTTLAPSYGVYSQLLYSINGAAAGASNKNIWSFGFNGTYNQGTLPAAVQLTDYVIKLQFTAFSITQ